MFARASLLLLHRLSRATRSKQLCEPSSRSDIFLCSAASPGTSVFFFSLFSGSIHSITSWPDLHLITSLSSVICEAGIFFRCALPVDSPGLAAPVSPEAVPPHEEDSKQGKRECGARLWLQVQLCEDESDADEQAQMAMAMVMMVMVIMAVAMVAMAMMVMAMVMMVMVIVIVVMAMVMAMAMAMMVMVLRMLAVMMMVMAVARVLAMVVARRFGDGFVSGSGAIHGGSDGDGDCNTTDGDDDCADGGMLSMIAGRDTHTDASTRLLLKTRERRLRRCREVASGDISLKCREGAGSG
eukprot:6205299-Pleurochrysis_carterae.AAC.3